jgi:hypothetical protein
MSHLGKSLFFYTLFLAGIIFYPFRFHFPVRTEQNQAAWLSEGNGIEFSGASEIRSKDYNERFNRTLIFGDGLTMEAWLATDDFRQEGPVRILSDSFDPEHRNFTLGQEGRNLIVRLRTENTDLNGFPETSVENVFLSPNPYHIVVTYDYRMERIYVNGREIFRSPSVRGRFSNWDPTYPLIFGNEYTGGSRLWHGRLFLAAFYKRSLSEGEVLQNYRIGRSYRSDGPVKDRRVDDGLIALYRFDEHSGSVIHEESGYGLDMDLVMPVNIKIDEEKEFLRIHAPEMQDVTDIMRNMFAFAIFGFLLNRYLRTKGRSSAGTVLWGIAVGVLFSFGSESIEYFVETHTSTMLDSATRMCGVAIGISVDFYMKYRKRT